MCSTHGLQAAQDRTAPHRLGGSSSPGSLAQPQVHAHGSEQSHIGEQLALSELEPGYGEDAAQ